MYEIIIVFSEEDAPMLLLKHGFIKVKRKWALKSNPTGYRFSTQDALQALSLSIISNEIRGEKKIKVRPPTA